MRAMKRNCLFFALVVLGMSSCVTEIRDFEQIGNDSFLTVEATLSNQKGPHQVVVSTSSPSITLNVDNKPVVGARVYLTDDKNGTVNLTEIVSGIYETSANYRGIVGNTYVLHINLPSGKKYESSPEKLIASPTIDNIKYNFNVKTNYPLTDARSVGFDLTLDFTDPPEPNQYYEWKWTHYERSLYCATCTLGYDYSLLKCSTTPNFPNGQTFPETINYQCYENCFDKASNTTYNILSDNLFNGQKVSNYPIARIPYNNKSLYYIQVEQRAISQKLYQYFRSIKDVTQNAGTLFDVPAETQFSPNIHSLDNANERILGAFEVFGSDKKIVYVDRQISSLGYSPVLTVYPGRSIPPPPGAISGPRAACTEGKYKTKTEPEAFKE